MLSTERLLTKTILSKVRDPIAIPDATVIEECCQIDYVTETKEQLRQRLAELERSLLVEFPLVQSPECNYIVVTF